MDKRVRINLFAALSTLGALALIPGYAGAGPDHAHSAKATGRYLAYIGTYTESGAKSTGSKGIYLSHFDTRSGHFTAPEVAAEGIRNPTAFAVDPRHRFLYAVEEIGNLKGVNGSIYSYAIDPRSGALKFLNKVSAEGGNPAHLVVDRTGKMLIDANYISGSVISFAINADGSIGRRTGFDQHHGSSINARQKGPHAHAVVISPDNRFLFVPDLGLDKVFIYQLNPAKATFEPNNPAYVSVNPGLGPRHFAFGAGAKFAYLVCEMGSSVVAFSYDHSTGALKVLQTISTLPPGFSGTDNSAEIQVHPSGRFLYASNRGNDSITLFRINSEDGRLTQVQVTPTQGKTPRHFAIDPSGKYLIAENQDTDSLVTFTIDQTTGKLTPTGDVIKTPAPCFIVFVQSPS